jgi:hypothetical protein
VRVEKSRLKVALLIARRYNLSRPMKDRKHLDRVCKRLDVTRNKSCLNV